MSKGFTYSDSYEEYEVFTTALEEGLSFGVEPLCPDWGYYEVSCFSSKEEAIAHAKRIDGLAYEIYLDEDELPKTKVFFNARGGQDD